MIANDLLHFTMPESIGVWSHTRISRFVRDNPRWPPSANLQLKDCAMFRRYCTLRSEQ